MGFLKGCDFTCEYRDGFFSLLLSFLLVFAMHDMIYGHD